MKKVEISEVIKNNIYFYDFNNAYVQVKVISSVLKGDKVKILFLEGEKIEGYVMTCKIDARLFKK